MCSLEIEDHIDILADHQRYKLQLGNIGCIVGPDERAVSKNGHSVADCKNLIQKVRNKDNSHSLCLQLPHNIEEKLHFIVVQ